MPAPGPTAPRPRTAELPREAKRTFRVATGRYPRSASGAEQAQYLAAIGGPLGFIPWVPATWASLAAAAFWWWRPAPAANIAAVTIILLFGGAWCCTTAERLAGAGDPRNVVLDEIAGQTLTFLLVAPVNWRLALAGFALFRILDIWKPFPARRLEKLPGGWGVMLDDLASGGWAALGLLALRALWPQVF
ncbi:MAG: phosphatidylglycerophosphatase A family protein [Terriglobales bacterium]